MIRSLRRFESAAPIWVLCLDDECRRLLERLGEPGVRAVPLSDLEEGDAGLRSAKDDRTRIEYYFTLTPSLVRFVQDRVAPDDTVTYVDGDLYFFSDPKPLHEELGAGAVTVIPHRFSEPVRHLEAWGVYNVGWLTFRNDSRGRAVAQWWRERCNEWCRNVLEADRFADQKYLERFEKLFEGVVRIGNPGANVAPWNIGRHAISREAGVLLIDGRAPLIFYHFHGLRALGRWAYLVRHHPYRAPFLDIVRREIYRPYVTVLAAITREVESLGGVRSAALPRDSGAQASPLRRFLAALRGLAREDLPSVLRGEIVLVLRGRAL